MIKRFITYYLPLLLGAFLQATICFADECEVTYKAYTGRWDASHAFSFVTESDAYFSKGLFPEYGLPRPAFQLQQYTLQSGYDGSAGGVRFSYVVPEENPYLIIHYAISGHIGYGGHEPMYDCIRVLSKDGIVGCPFEFVSGENISAEISKGYIVNTTSSVFFDGYFPWRNLIYNLSNYVGQTVTIEGIAACCDNVKCRTTLYMAFENFGPQELCTNCGVTKISIPDGMSSYIWHKGSPDGPIVSREQEIYVDWKHIDDYYCTLYPPYCNGTPFLMTKRIKSVASFDYRVACGEEKDTLYLTNKSYMYYEDNPSKHIPCDTVSWDFGNGYSTSEFTPNPITFDHNGIYEISLQVGNKDFVCDSTQYVTFETGNVSHNDKVDTICDSQLPYEWRGKQYMSSGDYYDTLTNRWGCDSLLHLSLVVHPTTYSYSAFTIKKGESVSWQGDTYTDAGTYTKILKNVYGCDSILTLTLTLLEPVSSDTYLTLCPGHIPYVWNGVLCLGAGEYSAVLKTAFGQDSIARLHLSVGSPARSDTSAVICLSDFPFEWHGQKINKGGIYTDIMPSIAGCDSVVTFIITEKDCSQIEPTDHPLDPMPFLPIRDTLDTTICIGDTLMWHGIAYAHDTTARDTGYYSWYPLDSVYWVLELKTEVCCDTTYSTTDTTFLYDSLKLHPFMWFEKEYVEPGVYNDTILNTEGCDSIGSLLLRVIYKDSLYACGDEQVTFHTPWGDYDSKSDCECLNGYLLQTLDGEWLVDATLCVNRLYTDTVREDTVLCFGTSIEWHGITVDQTHEYEFHEPFQRLLTCDSIVYILNATVKPEPLNHPTDTAVCAGTIYTWTTYRDSLITAPGIYYDTLWTDHGCYSDTYVLTLTHKAHTTGDTTAYVCYNDLPYEWHGKTLTEACDTSWTTTNIAGCDSVVTLHLFVSPEPKSEHADTTICYGDMIDWHGQPISAEGTYYDTARVTMGNGQLCDSIWYELAVTIQKSDTTTNNISICTGGQYTWKRNGKPDRVISEAGEYWDTVRYVLTDCDSMIYHLTLQIEDINRDSISDKTCAGIPYLWRGRLLEVSGVYRDTAKAKTETECDTIYTLLLTINQPTSSDTTATACDSFAWHGVIYTESTNEPIWTTTNAAGCDSVITLHLTIHKSGIGEESKTICDKQLPFIWKGQEYNEAGDYTFDTLTVHGCDSVITLHLYVDTYTTGDTTATACESFTWHGRTYTESTDTATWTTINAAGCDSVVTLHLTINYATSSEMTIQICDEELPYTWNGKDYTAEGDYTYQTINAAGCDSTATLHLKVIRCCPDTVMRRQELSICDTLMPYTWVTWREVVVEETGSFADTLRNDLGCDSIIYTLTLDTFHCCAPLMAAIDVPDYICADAPYLPIEVKLLSGECASYSLHFTNPALNKMPFRDTTITIDVQYASDEPFILDIPVPDDPDDSTHYVRPDDNYKVSLTLHDRCGNSIIFGDSIFSVYYPSWVTDQHWDDVIALLNDRYNGGYTFSAVQWLRNGEVLLGEDNNLYIYLPHELWTNPNHERQDFLYQALLTRTDDGKTIPTCPLEPRHIDNTNVLSDPYISVTPTLVPKENPVVHVMTNTEGTYWVYDPVGKLLQTADYEPCEHSVFDINLYHVQTMYILVFTPRNEKKPLKHKYSVVKVLVE